MSEIGTERVEPMAQVVERTGRAPAAGHSLPFPLIANLSPPITPKSLPTKWTAWLEPDTA